MAQYKLRVQKRIEDTFEVSVEAISITEAVHMMEAPDALDRTTPRLTSRDVKITVLECHSTGGAE